MSLTSLVVLVALWMPMSAAAADLPQDAPDRSFRHTRVRLRTGVELQVAQRGPDHGTPVLFLHGFADSWFSYSAVLDRLPPGIRAIVPTQRGHGDSERPKCCYRQADFAADAVALLDALGIARAHVVGHSMGTFVAQRVAIDHPDRVDRLVLIGGGRSAHTPLVLELNAAVQQLRDPVEAVFVRDFQHSSVAAPVASAFMETIVRESRKLPARVWRDTLAALVAADTQPQSDRITSPTLIIWGNKDALMTRTDQDRLVDAIPGARLVTYAGIGHSPTWEVPDRVAADLERFLIAPEPPQVRASEVHAHGAHAHADHSGEAKLLPGLGDWHHAITTNAPDAQQFFDQGLRLTYAFNHDEAIRSFERAIAIDPSCAMCHWGLAYALGPNINLPMDANAETRALAAIRSATRRAAGTTPVEQALIAAMAARYGEPAGEARAQRDAAYAAAMRDVARQFRDDADAQVLFADAMLNLRPWNQWTREGQPQPGTLELVAVLQQVVDLNANHAGACHFYVHAVEASPTPERALPCAERLPRLMPGAGHIVHMPAHVYLRVGRYEDAARANIAAVEADNRYFARGETTRGIYPMFYAPHNLHFLWAAYVLSGQQSKALDASRALIERVSLDEARTISPLEGFLPSVILTHLRFGDWDAVLRVPQPPADLRYASGMWHYARGAAFAARGEVDAAREELDRVRAIAAGTSPDVIILLNPAPALLSLASDVLAGDLAMALGRHDEAFAHYRSAVAREDVLTYDEPPPWYHSARNKLGSALLEAGRAADAEAAFRDDLRFQRETGWSLAGLERALRAQGKTDEANEVARRLKEAWKYADADQYATKRPGATR